MIVLPEVTSFYLLQYFLSAAKRARMLFLPLLFGFLVFVVTSYQEQGTCWMELLMVLF